MKKFLLLFAAALAVGLGAKAASPQIYAGYGGYTQMDATNMHDGGKMDTAWGAITAGIDFPVLGKFRIGPSYTFSSASHSHRNAYYHVIMLNGKYQYFSNSIVRLYGHVGIGADITHLSYRGGDDGAYNKGYFAFQVAPLGAEVDLGRQFAMYGELGFGAQGLLQVGFRVKI